MDSFDSNGHYVGLAKLSQLLRGDMETPEPDTPDYYCVLDGSYTEREVAVETAEGVDTVDNVQLVLREQVKYLCVAFSLFYGRVSTSYSGLSVSSL